MNKAQNGNPHKVKLEIFIQGQVNGINTIKHTLLYQYIYSTKL